MIETTPFNAMDYVKSDEDALTYILEVALESDPHDRDNMLLELIGHLRQAGALAMREAAAKVVGKDALNGSYAESLANRIRTIDPATLKGE